MELRAVMDKQEYKARMAVVDERLQAVDVEARAMIEKHSGLIGGLHPERLASGVKHAREVGSCAVELFKLNPIFTQWPEDNNDRG